MPLINESLNGSLQWFGGTSRTEVVRGAWRFYQHKPDLQRKKKPKGILTPLPYWFDESSGRPTFMKATLKSDPSYGCIGHFRVDEYGMGRLVRPAGVENRLVTKALLKLKDQRVNLGVAMAEAQDTANMIGDVTSRIARGYQALAAKDPKGALSALSGSRRYNGSAVTRNRPITGKQPSRNTVKRETDWVPDRWLEYQYGINPLLSDLKGAWEELQKQEGWSWVTTVRASDMSHDEMSIRSANWDQQVDMMCSADFHSHVVLNFMPQKYALQSIARLGMSNPFEIIWEKTPFSFVLDQVWPLGECLQALDATVGWEFLHGSYTTFDRYTTLPRPLFSGYSSNLETFTPGVARNVRFRRQVYGSVPWPKPPTIRNPLSLGQMANGLSLLASVFGKGRK